MKKTKVCAAISVIILLFSLTACADDFSSEVDAIEVVMNAVSKVESVETSIALIMDARIGSASSLDNHTASITSDITIRSTRAPLAYHAEMFSRILVDGSTTRENLEYYVVPEEGKYTQYAYDEAKDQWTRSILTRAEVLALPSRIGFLSDWEVFLSGAEEVNELENDKDELIGYKFTGTTGAGILQEIFGNKIFDSFMYSTERLLSDEIPFTLVIDHETYLPEQLTLSFKDCFIVSDMTFDTAEIIVTYSNYNEIDAINVPKKTTIIATDPTLDFYKSYFAWNLFLPYIQGQNTSGGSAGNSGLNFTSSWETFQVRIDSGMTQLPIKYEELSKLGYSIDSSVSNTIVEPNSYVENIPVLKGSDKLLCAFYNPTTSPQPINTCSIGGIDYIAGNILQNSIKIYLPGEVTLGISEAALLSAYGDPDSKTTGFSADTYIWKGEKENQSFLAEISPVTKQVIRMQLRNIPVTGN